MRLNKTIVALVAASLAVPCAFAASGVKSAGNAGKSSCVASTADPLMKVVVGNSYKSKKATTSCNKMSMYGEATVAAASGKADLYSDSYSTDPDEKVLFLNNLSAGLSAKLSDSLTFNTLATWIPEDATLTDHHFGLQEAYVAYADFAKTPVFMTLGKKMASFGNYKEINPVVRPLSQRFTQFAPVSAGLGFASAAGFNASAYIFQNNDATEIKVNSYGLAAEYATSYKDAKFKVNAQYLDDYSEAMSYADADHENHGAADIDGDLISALADNNSSAAYNIGVFAAMKDIHFGYQFFTTTKDIRDAASRTDSYDDDNDAGTADVDITASRTASKPQLHSFSVAYDFNARGSKADVHGLYEHMTSSSSELIGADFEGADATLATSTDLTPKDHYNVGVSMDVMKGAKLGLDYHRWERFDSSKANDYVASMSVKF